VPILAILAQEARNSAVPSQNLVCRSREFEIVEQGICESEAGNLQSRSREFKFPEQGTAAIDFDRIVAARIQIFRPPL
jgi:hypothetical protein